MIFRVTSDHAETMEGMDFMEEYGLVHYDMASALSRGHSYTFTWHGLTVTVERL